MLPFLSLLHLDASRARQRSSQVSLLDLILKLFLSSLGQLPASRVVVSTNSMLNCKCFHSGKICVLICKILCDAGQSVLNTQEENTESFPLKQTLLGEDPPQTCFRSSIVKEDSLFRGNWLTSDKNSCYRYHYTPSCTSLDL